MPTEAEIEAAFEVLHDGKTSPYIGPVQVTLTKEKVREALEAAERVRPAEELPDGYGVECDGHGDA